MVDMAGELGTSADFQRPGQHVSPTSTFQKTILTYPGNASKSQERAG